MVKRIFCFIIAILTIVPRVAAAGEFIEDYDVSYAISPAGITTVTQNITLTNATADQYPKKFTITIDTDKIGNVIAHDKGGVITPDIIQQDGKTEITLTFSQKIVGVGKSLAFTLRYENGSITQKIGRIWEVQIPGLKNPQQVRSYRVTFDAPTSFGPNAYLSPPSTHGRTWEKEQLTSGGITAAYGETQYYRLSLLYHLTNNESQPVKRQIALPPDTAYQKVSIESILPVAQTIERTDEGNWLADYTVSARTKIQIKVQLLVEIRIRPRDTYAIGEVDGSRYLSAQPYWETDNPTISGLAKQFTSPRAIYDYVRETLTYDYSRVEGQLQRKGAVAALREPQSALCSEFTDLFIAIARAAGIPARENVGFAYTTNPKLRPLSLIADVLHAWPEYYDKTLGLWVPVDPTWGNTTGGINYFDKLDFDHIVFAVHGTSSTLPLPAGFYREPDDPGKDIQVTFADVEAMGVGKLLTTVKLPSFVLSGFPIKGIVNIQNTTGSSIEKTYITISSKKYSFTKNLETQEFTPLAGISVPFEISTDNFFERSTADILVNTNDEIKRVYIPVYPFYLFVVPLAGVLIIVYGTGKLWHSRHKSSKRN